MTQTELELVAREMRDRGLYYSWDELLTFSKDVVGSLVDAYQTLLRSMAKSNTVSSTDPDDAQKLVRDKLVKALILLTDKPRIAKWESEVLTENNRLGTQGVEDLLFEEN